MHQKTKELQKPKELHPYHQWIDDVEKMIEDLQKMSFEVGTPEYYFKKSMILNYNLFKKGL